MQNAGSDLRYFERALRTRSGVLRAEIRDVLVRSDSERYADIAGQVHDVVCVRCREPIRRARLDVYPTAKRCLSCQEIHEREHAVVRLPTL
jgi:RNA polymerase-binding transcription factor DksA